RASLLTCVGVLFGTLPASDQLANAPFNPRLIGASNDRPRGAILDRNGAPLATSEKGASGVVRSYKDQSLAQVVGYASLQFGLSGGAAAYAESRIGQAPPAPVAIRLG